MNPISITQPVFYFAAFFRMDKEEPTDEKVLSYLTSSKFKQDFPNLHVFDVDKPTAARGISTKNTHSAFFRADFKDAIEFVQVQNNDKEFKDFCEKYNPKHQELCIYDPKDNHYSIFFMR